MKLLLTKIMWGVCVCVGNNVYVCVFMCLRETVSVSVHVHMHVFTPQDKYNSWV